MILCQYSPTTHLQPGYLSTQGFSTLNATQAIYIQIASNTIDGNVEFVHSQ